MLNKTRVNNGAWSRISENVPLNFGESGVDTFVDKGVQNLGVVPQLVFLHSLNHNLKLLV